MKNFDTTHDATLTLSAGGQDTTVPLYSAEGLGLLSNLWIKAAAEQRLMYETNWLGRPIIQFPTDVVAMQELIWQIKPDVVVETGVAHGGSLVLSASILALLGKGKVVGIDIEVRPHNRAAIEAHPLAERIHLIEGSSIDPAVVAAAAAHCEGAKTVMVVLDSNHSYAHVRQELEAYHRLVTPGSYIVCHDGAQAWVWDIPRGKPEWKDDHPLKAIDEFVGAHPDFSIDQRWTRLQITSSPNGYLRRANPQEMQHP